VRTSATPIGGWRRRDRPNFAVVWLAPWNDLSHLPRRQPDSSSVAGPAAMARLPLRPAGDPERKSRQARTNPAQIAQSSWMEQSCRAASWVLATALRVCEAAAPGVLLSGSCRLLAGSVPASTDLIGAVLPAWGMRPLRARQASIRAAWSDLAPIEGRSSSGCSHYPEAEASRCSGSGPHASPLEGTRAMLGNPSPWRAPRHLSRVVWDVDSVADAWRGQQSGSLGMPASGPGLTAS
jgi:hypothetical protein